MNHVTMRERFVQTAKIRSDRSLRTTNTDADMTLESLHAHFNDNHYIQ